MKLGTFGKVMMVVAGMAAAGCGGEVLGGKKKVKPLVENVANADGTFRACYMPKDSQGAREFSTTGVAPAGVCIEMQSDYVIKEEKCREGGGHVQRSCSSANVAVRCDYEQGSILFYNGWTGSCD